MNKDIENMKFLNRTVVRTQKTQFYFSVPFCFAKFHSPVLY